MNIILESLALAGALLTIFAGGYYLGYTAHHRRTPPPRTYLAIVTKGAGGPNAGTERP